MDNSSGEVHKISALVSLPLNSLYLDGRNIGAHLMSTIFHRSTQMKPKFAIPHETELHNAVAAVKFSDTK